LSLHKNPAKEKVFDICKKAKIQEEFYLVVTSNLKAMTYTEDEIQKMSKGTREDEDEEI